MVEKRSKGRKKAKRTKKEKTPVSQMTKKQLRLAKKIHRQRSKRSRKLDEKYAGKVPKYFETWLKHPDRYDLPGVDLGKIKRSHGLTRLNITKLAKLWKEYKKVSDKDFEKSLKYEDKIFETILRTLGHKDKYSRLKKRATSTEARIQYYVEEINSIINQLREAGIDTREIEESPLLGKVRRIEYPSEDIVVPKNAPRSVLEKELEKLMRKYEETYGVKIPRSLKKHVSFKEIELVGSPRKIYRPVLKPVGMPLSYFARAMKTLYIARHGERLVRELEELRGRLTSKYGRKLYGRYRVVEEGTNYIVLENVKSGKKVKVRWSFSHGTRISAHPIGLMRGAVKPEYATLQITGDKDEAREVYSTIYGHLLRNDLEDNGVVALSSSHGFRIRYIVDEYSFAWDKKQSRDYRKTYAQDVKETILEALSGRR